MKTVIKFYPRALLWCSMLIGAQLTASAATLVHRYSFSDIDNGTGNIGSSVADSVGGASWNGILPNGGTFTGTQLQFAAFSQQYMQMPAGILSNYTAVTIDTWATFGTLPVNCFFFGFGATDGGGAGQNYIFCAPQGGRIAITGADPGYTGEQGCGGAGDLSSLTVHVTAVFNPPLGFVALYTNGVLVSANLGVTTPMTSISNALNYIARSLYTADPYPDITVDEFRIWNGGLNPLEIAGDDVSGPDTVGTNYGSVTNIQLTVPTPLAIGAGSKASVVLSASGLLNSIPIGTPDVAVSYLSLNTNIATVNPTNGTVIGVSSGIASIVASYSSVSATQQVQVIALPTTMVHRYSFNDGTANDSIGTANGTLFGDANVSSGQLNLDGVAGSYCDLGSGIISPTNIPNNAITLEGWVTCFPTNGAWARVFDFGNIVSGAGANYIFFAADNAANGGNARVAVSDTSPGNADEAGFNVANILGRTNMHFAVVFNPNPSSQTLSLYENGNIVASTPTTSQTLATINNVFSFLGRSGYSGDSWLSGSINEFRIYNGALDRFQIAASFQAGPDQTNFNLGTLTNFSLSAGTQPMALNSSRTLSAALNFTLVTNVLVIGDPNLTLSSGNTNVFTVTSPAGVITARGVGSANLTAVYRYTSGATTTSFTNTLAISVYRDQLQTLQHRYSFTADASDSVGGSAWDGTEPNGATFAGGQVELNMTNTQYIQLPAGVISNYPAVTIEAWVTSDPNNGFFSFFYGFGNTDGNGLGNNYLFGSLNRAYAAVTDADPGYLDEQGIFAGPGLQGTVNLHWTAVYDPPAGYIALYTNGVLAGINNAVTIPLSSTVNVLNYIGRSLYNGDPYPNLSVDEFRIYSGALHADEIAATQVLGANAVLSTNSPVVSISKSGSSFILSWPLASAGFTLLQSASITGPWTPVSSGTPQIVGSAWQYTVPASGSAQFFRLSR